MVSTDGKAPGCNEGIKLVLFYGKVFGTITVNLYVITFGVDVGTEMGSVDGYFDGYNGGNIEGLLLGEYLGYTDGNVLSTIPGNVDRITLGIDVVTDMGSLDGSFGNVLWILWWTKPP